MSRRSLWAPFHRLADRASLQPDLSRALRASIAFMVPLLLALNGWISFESSLVAIAAQNIAMVDMRGDYRLRLLLLLGMAAVFAGAAAVGATVADNLTVTVLATGLLAVSGGVWRHLSSDYGPALAVSSSLVFFLSLAAPHAAARAAEHATAALIGGLWGVLVQVAGWPFRPQHPLRRTVAESFLGVARVFEALAPPENAASAAAREGAIEAETALRTTLDHTYATLEASRPGPLRQRLEALNLAAARLATRVVALDTALESARRAVGFKARVPSLEPALASLANLARSAAVAVVSRQPGHLAAFEVRQRRVASLLGVLQAQLATDPANAPVTEIVKHIERMLAELHAALRATIERAEERTAVALDLPDLRSRALRPLASALNLSRDVDPALVRFTLRLAALTMIATTVFKLQRFPHGYWLPFTIVVVLQPDYGSTRQRAFQRVFGTLAGSLLASALLSLQLPVAVLLGATAGGVFGFAYFLKRNYAVAIFFVTVFIVLLTEASEPLTIAFTIERLASTLAGGALALLAAVVFWPVWEKDRLPPILARTFRANHAYLNLLLARLGNGTPFEREGIAAKRAAEASNSAAFSSLRRLSGDPKNRRDGLEHAAALVNGNQRLTRALNILTLHLGTGQPLPAAPLSAFGELAGSALERLAAAAEQGTPPPGQLEPLIKALETDPFPNAATDRERWVFDQLRRAATELGALLLVVQNDAPAWDEMPPAAPVISSSQTRG